MPKIHFMAHDATLRRDAGPALIRRAHAPQPLPETVPPPGPPEMPELPDEVPGDPPPDVIDPPGPEVQPPITEPGKAPPVRMCGLHRRSWPRHAAF